MSTCDSCGQAIGDSQLRWRLKLHYELCQEQDAAELSANKVHGSLNYCGECVRQRQLEEVLRQEFLVWLRSLAS
jgi:hypothetical protein